MSKKATLKRLRAMRLCALRDARTANDRMHTVFRIHDYERARCEREIATQNAIALKDAVRRLN